MFWWLCQAHILDKDKSEPSTMTQSHNSSVTRHTLLDRWADTQDLPKLFVSTHDILLNTSGKHRKLATEEVSSVISTCRMTMSQHDALS